MYTRRHNQSHTFIQRECVCVRIRASARLHKPTSEQARAKEVEELSREKKLSYLFSFYRSAAFFFFLLAFFCLFFSSFVYFVVFRFRSFVTLTHVSVCVCIYFFLLRCILIIFIMHIRFVSSICARLAIFSQMTS